MNTRTGLAGLVVLAGCASGAAAPAPAPAPVTVDAAAPAVSSSSSVARPSPSVTPDSVTAASPAHATQGSAVVPDATAGPVDGTALRERHRARLAADVSPVTVLAGGTPSELGERLCEAVVPHRPPGTPVLVKPNLGGFNWFHDPKTHHGDDGVKGRITDPEFVRGVIRCLHARGYTHITIADGFTGVPHDWDRLVRISGYGAMAKQEGVALVALDDDGVFDTRGDRPGQPLAVRGLEHTHVPTLLMPRGLADHLERGLFITVPKIKAHRFSVFSLGIKGMQGTVMYSDASPAFHQKGRSHRELDGALAAIHRHDAGARATYVHALERFAERMADVLELEAPDAELAEGAPAMDGDGFDELYPRAENVAIGGTNVVAVDRVAAEYLGLWDNPALGKELGGHRTSPLLEVAAARLGVDLTKVRVTGDGAAALAAHGPAHLHAMAGFEIVDRAAPPEAEAVPAAAKADLHAARLAGAGWAAGSAPTIDDAAWSAAPALEFATNWSGRATPTRTRVRALWSPAALYVRFELDGAGLFTDRTRPTDRERNDLYEEDCVEMFVAPDPANRKRYAEIELGPFGHWYDLLVDWWRRPRGDDAWSAGLTIHTSQDAAAHRAVIEVAIAAPEVVKALAPGARLPLGLYRMEGRGTRAYLAAFPTRTAKPNFHVPDAFGTLVIDP